MKKIKTYYWLVALLFVAASCQPKYEFSGVVPESAINISVTQNTTKDNIVYLSNSTQGIIPYWDYGIGYSTKQQDTINIPFAGQYNVIFTALDKGGTTSVTKTVTVSKNDDAYFADPMWNLLTNGIAGKTWVWDDTLAFCHGNGPVGASSPQWWKVPYSEMEEIGEMTFDLNKAENFSKTVTGGSKTTGLFILDVTNQTLKITGTNILWGADTSTDRAIGDYYTIISLTATKLVLARIAVGWETVWCFKAQ